MNKQEALDKLKDIKNLTVIDLLPMMRFQILIKVKHIENIPLEHRFGRIIYNPKPALTNGSEPYCYLDNITIEDLKKDYAEQGMSKQNLEQFDLFKLVTVYLNPVEKDEE